MPKSDYDFAAQLDADASALAALALAEAIFVAMIRSGTMSKEIALDALRQVADRLAPKGALHTVAAEKLRIFGKNVAGRSDISAKAKH